jgi:protein ImuB
MSYACLYIPNFEVHAALRGEPGFRSQPTAVSARRSPAEEESAHAALIDLGFSFSPRLEDAAAGTIILDLAGFEHLLGLPREIAARMAQRASELGLRTHVAIASNPEAALHAARGFTGITLIAPGEEREKLGCLPLEVLQPSAEILETLHRWGVHHLKALASLPTAQLSERLGQEGVRLQTLARGAALRPLVPTEARLEFEERMELEDPIEQLESLAFALGLLLNRLCGRLAVRALSAHELLLDLKLEAPLREDQVDPDPTKARYEARLRLPVPTQSSKTLLKLLHIHLCASPPGAAVIEITIRAEAAKPRVAQGGLFLPASPDPDKLEITLARVTRTVGEGNLGSPELVDTHRPGAFRMIRFNPWDNPISARRRSQTSRRDCELPQTDSNRREPVTALRVFRPPLPARVDTREGIPVRVSFAGVRGEVISAAGPWRATGDWWREDGYGQDEWDVELKHKIVLQAAGPEGRTFGLYRIFRDLAGGDWFVQGSYD